MNVIFPNIIEKFNNNDIFLEIFICPWIICLFTKNFSKDIVEVIWDNLLTDKKYGFVKVILTIMSIF